MAAARPLIAITNTSVLLNFLRIDRTALLGAVAASVVLTEHVEAEVTEHYPEQVARLRAGLAKGHFRSITLTGEPELAIFGRLMGLGRLGSGECAAIAGAICGGHALAIDDRKASREALRIKADLAIVGTADLVAMMIREGSLSVDEADAMKTEWERAHRSG
ncbi:MAG TPA: hypothetical protein PKD49_15300 [Hyphomicrobium sp.]|nr:hypothetical protein [Hyphomicrobium sp.]